MKIIFFQNSENKFPSEMNPLKKYNIKIDCIFLDFRLDIQLKHLIRIFLIFFFLMKTKNIRKFGH